MQGYFITGTDTGVGKTLIGGAIARAWVQLGKSVGVLKPVETGCEIRGNRLIPEDALFLKEMARCPEDIVTVCPYRLQPPLAPWVAATVEKVRIEVTRINSIFLEMQEKYDVILVEGAGGLMVPIDENFLTCDLIKILDLPVIIVARLSLGTINHTLLTVTQAQNSQIKITGIILNQLSPQTGKAEETNPYVIKKISDVTVLGQIPYISKEKRKDADYLAGLALDCIDFKILG
jgi:dethiobiotin synthetase